VGVWQRRQHLGASLAGAGVRSAIGPGHGGAGSVAQTRSAYVGGLVRERGVWAGTGKRKENMGPAQNE
jgi:hypothetical protein